MSGLSERIKREPNYRPYCLNCSTMMRMTLEADGKTMWCAPVRDTTHDGLVAFGLRPVQRLGCGLRFDIETGQRVDNPARSGEEVDRG